MGIPKLRLGELTEDEVILGQLRVANLLLQCVAAQINVDEHLLLLEDALDLFGVRVKPNANRHNHDLPRAQPERPPSGEVLSQNTREALNTAGHGTVNHHWAGTTCGQGLDLGSGDLAVLSLLLGLFYRNR